MFIPAHPWSKFPAAAVLSQNPNGVSSISPELRGTSYAGLTAAINPSTLKALNLAVGIVFRITIAREENYRDHPGDQAEGITIIEEYAE